MKGNNLAPAGMGLTPRMKEALAAIVGFVGRHGVMPSRRLLASELRCNPNNANRLMASLIERGELCSVTPGGALSGFGRDGVAVFVPAHVAAALAAFCAARDEKISTVVADAIVLHLDQLGEAE